ncbi:hypothetical protein MAIC_37860 [Mycolicibacterium aichiense]|uniref:Uncharacterized protein n=1 Tax=Mycolicibacterium aichiense TaxID=1799 RepID=A0AAD1HNZ8_9MYCO|nr:hypothetical protein MAIC_37860 [Mycolicibacterium aichiense]
MPDTHAPAVGEVDDLRRLAETQHVRSQYPIVPRQFGNHSFPTDFGTHTELAPMQEYDRLTFARLEEVRRQAVDDKGPMLEAHLIAIGLTGDPTAPVTDSGGATSWNS